VSILLILAVREPTLARMQPRIADRPAAFSTTPESETHAGPSRSRRRRRHRILRVFVALVSAMGALAFPLVSVTRLHDHPPWVGFRVEGKWRYGPPGTMFLATVDKFGLRPTSGSLLDVGGEVLRSKAFPGKILLNGRVPQTDDVPLAEGDRITVKNGRDHVEPIVREVTHIPAGKVTNPQFYLGTTPGDQIVEKGKVSGQVISTVFRPEGEATRPNSVALTFDDGPWPTQTAQFLAVLKKFKVKATFFLVGYLAERYPDIVRAEIRAGMQIGDHSWDHPNSPPFGTLSRAMINEEIGKTRKLLTGYGVDSVVFRPPGGSSSDAVVAVAAKFDMRVVIWSVDPKDWMRGRTTAAIVKAVLSQVRPGSIILMHDGGGDRAAGLAALPRIIKGIRKMGLGFSTLEP
jgi:peptidoglycan/xylan/chitin deacetylase (PgdA/CDA1 family)